MVLPSIASGPVGKALNLNKTYCCKICWKDSIIFLLFQFFPTSFPFRYICRKSLPAVDLNIPSLLKWKGNKFIKQAFRCGLVKQTSSSKKELIPSGNFQDKEKYSCNSFRETKQLLVLVSVTFILHSSGTLKPAQFTLSILLDPFICLKNSKKPSCEEKEEDCNLFLRHFPASDVGVHTCLALMTAQQTQSLEGCIVS